MSILIGIISLLTFYIGWDWATKQRSKNATKRNSMIFDPVYTKIWRTAAADWIEDEDDSRSFDQFFIDTSGLIRNVQRVNKLP